MASKHREAELNSLLAQSEQLYRKLQSLVPNSDVTGLSSIPEDRKSLAATIVHVLISNCDAIDRVLQKASLDGLPQAAAGSGIQFYRGTLRPSRDSLVDLLMALLEIDVDIDIKTLRTQGHRAPVWNILVSGLDFWRQDPSSFPEDDLEAAENLLHSAFFSPDEWLRNADELQPVLGEKADQRLPINVRRRVREVYQSFVLGNYLASIALSRAILEYALVDRAANLRIQIYSSNPRFPNRVRRLAELVEDAAERLPGLKIAMEGILDAGNQTLHPKKRDNLVLLPHLLRSLARDSVHSIREVIEALYLRTDISV